MATKAGSIVIDIDAGTSKFVLDMEAAKGKIREFGHTTESSHKQAAAAVKALEGNLLNNTRAADAFLVSIKGLALGDHFGIKGLGKLAGGKDEPLGSSPGKAMWVQMVAKSSGAGAGLGDLKIGDIDPSSGDTVAGTGGAGGLGGIFGSLIPGLAKFGSDTDGLTGSGSGTAGALGGFFGSLFKSFGGGMADGGDVNPYSTYLVGEHAPEFFTPRTAGTITPLNKGMGGQNHYYTIDARGAALGVENRIARSIDMAHTSAIQHAVQASNERSKRVPQKHR